MRFRALALIVSLSVLSACPGPTPGGKTTKVSTNKKYGGHTKKKVDPRIGKIVESDRNQFVHRYKVPKSVQSLGGAKFDIPVVVNGPVQGQIDHFVNGAGRGFYTRALGRSTRFAPTQLRVLKEMSMPKDLIFLSMIESGFNPKAFSSAAASGLWQFIVGTGRMYDLESDSWVDERRDPEKSSAAAARHLRDLYEQYGDWYLAFAAYNAGAGKVNKAITMTGSRDFWTLAQTPYLRQETKDYVPRIIAAAIIGKNPEKYGFHVAYDKEIPTDKVTVSSPTSLTVVAECAGTSTDLIRLLNPELRRDVTPPDRGSYVLNVPRGTKNHFESRYAKLDASERLPGGIPPASKTPVVASNEYIKTGSPSLASLISEKIDIASSKRSSKKQEREERNSRNLEKDPELRVAWKEDLPTRSQPALSERLPDPDSPVLADLAPSPTVMPAVASQDPKPASAAMVPSLATTDSDSEGTAPSPAVVASADQANTDPNIQKIEVVNIKDEPQSPTAAASTASLPSNQVARPSAALVQIKKTNEEPTVGLKPSSGLAKAASGKTIIYKAKKGEFLKQIADRYGVSLADLREWNRLDPKKPLFVGQKLVIRDSKNSVPLATKEEPKSGAASPVVAKAAGVKPQNTPLASPPKNKTIAYKVRKGDTLHKIAAKYEVKVQDLVSLNRLARNSAIRPGLVLKIPNKDSVSL